MTVEEFLAWDDGTATRYELIGGEPVAMAPPADSHGLVVVAVASEFRARLSPPCRARAEAGVRVPQRNDVWFQADIVVACGPANPKSWVIEPVVIVEVLSPSTEGHDRSVKLPLYREIPSVRDILLISAVKRRAELWHRADGVWHVSDLIGDGTLEFPSVGVAFPLAPLYDGID